MRNGSGNRTEFVANLFSTTTNWLSRSLPTRGGSPEPPRLVNRAYETKKNFFVWNVFVLVTTGLWPNENNEEYVVHWCALRTEQGMYRSLVGGPGRAIKNVQEEIRREKLLISG